MCASICFFQLSYSNVHTVAMFVIPAMETIFHKERVRIFMKYHSGTMPAVRLLRSETQS